MVTGFVCSEYGARTSNGRAGNTLKKHGQASHPRGRRRRERTGDGGPGSAPPIWCELPHPACWHPGQAALDTCDPAARSGETQSRCLSPTSACPACRGVEFLGKAHASITRTPSGRSSPRTPIPRRPSRPSTRPRSTTTSPSHGTRRKNASIPVLDDLLETWKRRATDLPLRGLRVHGASLHGCSDHQVRDFLSRNRVPYVWLDPEQNAEGVDLLTRFKLDDHKLPVVLFGDGSYLGATGPNGTGQ